MVVKGSKGMGRVVVGKGRGIGVIVGKGRGVIGKEE